jgi:hypothetical protein
MLPKSNNIAVFALDLKAAYEGEHTILVFLVWLKSLRMMFSSSNHLLANGKISLFYMAK